MPVIEFFSALIPGNTSTAWFTDGQPWNDFTEFHVRPIVDIRAATPPVIQITLPAVSTDPTKGTLTYFYNVNNQSADPVFVIFVANVTPY